MKILKITPILNKQILSVPKRTVFKGLDKDTFIKTGAVENINEVNIEELKKNPKEMLKLYQSVISDERNKIGSGYTHSVYKIPGNDDYVFRTLTDNIGCSMDIESAEYEDKEESKGLDVNIGQKVGELKYLSDNNHVVTVELKRFVKGDSIGVPPIQALRNKDEYDKMPNKEHYAKTIAQTAKLPVEAYEKLITDFQKVYEAGYHFDHLNSNNLLADEEGQSINLIDLDKLKLKPNYGNLLYALTNIEYFETYTSQYDANPVSNEKKYEALINTMQIIDKFTQAMQRQNVKFIKNENSYEFMKFLSSFPCYAFCNSNEFDAIWSKFEQMGIAD